MTVPMRPVKGMRVTYGRCGFTRTGWKGKIVSVNCSNFEVEWDEFPQDTTTYRTLAWACTQFKNRYRNRDKHYIFFDENSSRNKYDFPTVFGCGVNNHPSQCSEIEITEFKICTLDALDIQGIPTIVMEKEMENTIVKKVLVRGTDITTAREETLIQLICSLEGDIGRLESIKVKSKRIAALVEENQEAVAAVAEELDSRA